MNYLLDTHTFLWLLMTPQKLSAQVKRLVHQPNVAVFVSVVTFWEIALKYALGKLQLTGVTPENFPSLAQESGLEIMVLDSQEAASVHLLPKIGHKDPFDRMLVWQAIGRGYTLVSKDKELVAYKKHGLKLVW